MTAGMGTYRPKDIYGNVSPVVQLFCGNDLLGQGYKRWSQAELKDYLFYYINGTPLDSLFRAVLFSPRRMMSNRFLASAYTGFEPAANRDDWEEWLNELFMPQGNLVALRDAVLAAPIPIMPVDVWVTLPYPEGKQENFGIVAGQPLNFTQPDDRLKALQWWIAAFANKWTQMGLEGVLRLRGLSWGREVVNDLDTALIPQVGAEVHAQGKQLLWVTNYGTAHADEWSQLGFDIAVLFSNYRGNTPLGRQWIQYAASYAKSIHAGVQWKYGTGLLDGENALFDFFNGGLPTEDDYMNNAFTVGSFENTGIRSLYEQHLPLYIALYSYNKGLYQKSTYAGMNY